MHDLVEQIKLSLGSQNSLLWLPHLTEGLAKLGWQNLTHYCGLTEFNYSTGRLVSGNPEAQCVIAARLSSQANALEGDQSPIYIELLTEDITLKYQKGGVDFYTAEEIAGTMVLDCLADAITILTLVPTLANTVATLAKALHVIKPKNGEYDVSFTEPDIPFSVFVSVPFKRGPNDMLRTAEGILHEAMHLQLTLIEQITPLVKHSSKKYYSPWRDECRTAQGVLHALYVFRVIDQFLEYINAISSSVDKCTDYVHKRRKQIAEQIAEVYSFQDCPDLTWAGKSLVRMLIR
jgi:HEXXH motif-containing protein